MTLTKKPVGFRGPIVSLCGEADIKERLLELGFVRGKVVEIITRSLFGDPVIVKVGPTIVALRQKELECIQI